MRSYTVSKITAYDKPANKKKTQMEKLYRLNCVIVCRSALPRRKFATPGTRNSLLAARIHIASKRNAPCSIIVWQIKGLGPGMLIAPKDPCFRLFAGSHRGVPDQML